MVDHITIEGSLIVLDGRPVIVNGKVLCQCGKEPLLSLININNSSSNLSIGYIMRCPSCGDKGQKPYKSQILAISVWENENWAK